MLIYLPLVCEILSDPERSNIWCRLCPLTVSENIKGEDSRGLCSSWTSRELHSSLYLSILTLPTGWRYFKLCALPATSSSNVPLLLVFRDLSSKRSAGMNPVLLLYISGYPPLITHDLDATFRFRGLCYLTDWCIDRHNCAHHDSHQCTNFRHLVQSNQRWLSWWAQFLDPIMPR